MEGPRAIAASGVDAKCGHQGKDHTVCNDDRIPMGVGDGCGVASVVARDNAKRTGSLANQPLGASSSRVGGCRGAWRGASSKPAADWKDGRSGAGVDEEHRGAGTAQYVHRVLAVFCSGSNGWSLRGVFV